MSLQNSFINANNIFSQTLEQIPTPPNTLDHILANMVITERYIVRQPIILLPNIFSTRVDTIHREEYFQNIATLRFRGGHTWIFDRNSEKVRNSTLLAPDEAVSINLQIEINEYKSNTEGEFIIEFRQICGGNELFLYMVNKIRDDFIIFSETLAAAEPLAATQSLAAVEPLAADEPLVAVEPLAADEPLADI